MDCSLRGSSVHGTFQARVLEWGAIAFSIFYATVVIVVSHPHLPLIAASLLRETLIEYFVLMGSTLRSETDILG